MDSIRVALKFLLWISLFFGTACSAGSSRMIRQARVEVEPAAPPATLEIVETTPSETTLDSPDLRQTHDVWRELVVGAKERIDIAQFYTSNVAGSRLDGVVQALRAAAKRGVRVRLLVDGKFSTKYPDTLGALAEIPGLQLRIFHVEPIMGGILHAKYFVVDGAVAFLGSQNFDWRSLEHIHELGVVVAEPTTVNAIQAVFDTDWHLAGGAAKIPAMRTAYKFPVQAQIGGHQVEVTPVFSPKEWVPDPDLWDLPRIVALMDGAVQQIEIQLLSFKTRGYHGEAFPTLLDTLLRAADRGVQIRLLISHWNTGAKDLPALRSLHAHRNITVAVATIPQWSGGFIPFARVVHAKYMVVDELHSWVGTSNWGPGYFFTSRNLGLIVRGKGFAAPLVAVFDQLWASPYTAPLKTDEDYPRPRIGK